MTCPTCHGSGAIKWTKEDDPHEFFMDDCPTCDGEGEVDG